MKKVITKHADEMAAARYRLAYSDDTLLCMFQVATEKAKFYQLTKELKRYKVKLRNRVFVFQVKGNTACLITTYKKGQRRRRRKHRGWAYVST